MDISKILNNEFIGYLYATFVGTYLFWQLKSFTAAKYHFSSIHHIKCQKR